ncbi:MAG: hypothetical protein WCJ18_08915, partial [Planctomycetota bacterium]
MPVNSTTDTLWMLVRWTVPVAVAGVVAAGAIGSSRVGEEIRSRVEARLAEEFPALTVQVQGASLVEGEGIVVRGVSLIDPKMPQQWRQILWVDELRLACNTDLTALATGPPRITAVQLRRPVVHAVRHADGSWNLAKLWRQRTAGALVPVSVEDATLLVDDTCRQLRATLRQITCDVQPAESDQAGAAWAAIRGSVTGDFFDRAAFQGRVAPSSGAFELEGDVEALDITPQLAALIPEADERIGGGQARDWITGLRGRCSLRWQTSGRVPALDEALFAVSGRLESGRFQHGAIPFAMTDLTAGFRADRSGVLVENLEAHSGSTLLRGSGRLAGWRRDADFDLLLDAERLTVSRQWEAHLPEQFAAQWRKLLPAGEVDLRAQLTRRAGRIDPKISVRCRNASITHYRFPYR